MNKKNKYYLKSNTRLPNLKRLYKIAVFNYENNIDKDSIYGNYESRKLDRKELRNKLLIDIVKFIFSIPQHNLITLCFYLAKIKTNKNTISM